MTRAVFLDRDGVLIEDVQLLTTVADIRILNGVPQSLCRLKQAGLLAIVVSNQAVVARGLMSEPEMTALHDEVEQRLRQNGAPAIDGFYYCPHHPNATMPAYRADCACRKPQSGLLLRAAQDHDIDLTSSFMIGDRITDIIAGAKAGCRTVLVRTGAHLAPPIETSEPLDTSISPDHTCLDLTEAAKWILDVL